MDILQAARDEIDIVDREMAQLFCRRMSAVKQVVEHKKQTGMAVLDAAREEKVVEKNLALLSDKHKEYAEFYEDFIRHNMALSRAMQKRILCIDKVAYQGAEGAFTHIAAGELYPHATLTPYSTWADVFEAVVSGDVFCGVLPFENSHAGDVSDVLDLCYATQNIVVSDVFDLPINQNLLCVRGAVLSDVKSVLSHPQALSQSAKMIRSLGLKAEAFPNTAIAAQHVAKTGDKSIAAIASTKTAELYGLDVLMENVNESKDNTTRFIVIEKCDDISQFLHDNSTDSLEFDFNESTGDILNKKASKKPEDSRFSLLFTTKHEVGSLSGIVQKIAAFGYNMECIKSRPIPHASWEYYFYTELVGKPSKDFIDALKANCNTIRLLGTYTKKSATKN